MVLVGFRWFSGIVFNLNPLKLLAGDLRVAQIGGFTGALSVLFYDESLIKKLPMMIPFSGVLIWSSF